jgi:DNA-binding GntR family transcriptional regulator
MPKRAAVLRRAHDTSGPVPTYTALKDSLRADIISGVLAPGVRLKITELARRFGTSTMPVRQALQDLHAEGVVVNLPNRGASVRQVDEHLAECIYDVRKHLMVLVIERCVRFISNVELDTLRQMERAIRQGRDIDQIVPASEAFYREIFRIARNDLAMDMLNGVWPLISALRRHFGLRDQTPIGEDNQALLEALARRDAAEAVRIAQKTCEESKADLMQRLRRLQPLGDEQAGRDRDRG